MIAGGAVELYSHGTVKLYSDGTVKLYSDGTVKLYSVSAPYDSKRCGRAVWSRRGEAV